MNLFLTRSFLINVLILLSVYITLIRTQTNCLDIFKENLIDREWENTFEVYVPYSDQNSVINVRVYVQGLMEELYNCALSLEDGSVEKALEHFRRNEPMRYVMFFNASLPAPKVTKIEVRTTESCEILCVGEEDKRPDTAETYMTHTYYPFAKSRAVQPDCNSPEKFNLTIRSPSPPDISSRSGSTSEDYSCGRVSLSSRIYLGRELDRGEWPWLVALYVVGNLETKFKCGATLIKPRVILTAAHCLYDGTRYYRPNEIVGIVGRYDLFDWAEDGFVAHRTRNIIIHPNYDPQTSDADIAIIITEKSVDYNNITAPICLWYGSAEINVIAGKEGEVAGWGEMEDGRTSRKPRLAGARFVTSETCAASNDFYAKLQLENKLCAGNLDYSGPCRGDSGGALILFHEGHWRIRGIVSSSIESGVTNECDLSNFALYTDVAKYTRWINRKTARLSN